MIRFMFLAVSVLLSILLSAELFALPRFLVSNSGQRDVDQDTYLGINRNLVFLDNQGNLGTDGASTLGKTEGWYYPFTGNLSDILDGTENRTVVYSSGICFGGMVNGEVRVALTEYTSEFVPGPMTSGTYSPDEVRFRVYKLDQSSGPGDPDWDEWPADLGAPIDAFGFPSLRGDQSLWTVFNDADPAGHGNMNGGNTAPLGVEVQVSSWGFVDPGGQDVIYVRYKLYNRGSNSIEGFYFSFWADPDLGSIGDDLVGCDPSTSTFYCYNADDADDIYGSQPPAWGARIVSGFVVPSAGEIGVFDGKLNRNRANLGMTSFAKYVNGTDPQSPQEFYNYMSGLDKDGSVVIDPITMLPTTFAVSGDPVSNTGWVDSNPSDRRLMASIGPIVFNPGDSQQVEIVFGTRIGANRLESITALKSALGHPSPLQQQPATFVLGGAVYAYQLTAVEPAMVTCYVGYFDEGYTPSDVDLSSLAFDGIPAMTSEYIQYLPAYQGPAVALEFLVRDLLEPMMPIFGNTLHEYSVSGQYTDGQDFDVQGRVVIAGKARGDVNGDGKIAISDVVGLVNYIFSGGPAPEPLFIGDTDCSGSISVSDAVRIIAYIFGERPGPMCP